MSDTTKIEVFLDPHAKLPTQTYQTDVGYDLYALEDYNVLPGQFVEIKTGVHLIMPPDMYATINTRSGHGQRGIMCHAGTIDPGFTGEVLVWLYNIGAKANNKGLVVKNDFYIRAGDRVAQLVFHKAEHVTLKKTKTIPKTDRGENGYGSSGN